MAEYTKSTHFSAGWMIGGAVLMFITGFFARFIIIGVGIQDTRLLLAILLGAYAVAGFVIGWQSEGRTIIEAGLAAVLATAGMIGIVATGSDRLDLVATAIIYGPPVLAAVIGAVIGEKIQGDVIVTSDD
jgi:hypothetical protein